MLVLCFLQYIAHNYNIKGTFTEFMQYLYTVRTVYKNIISIRLIIRSTGQYLNNRQVNSLTIRLTDFGRKRKMSLSG